MIHDHLNDVRVESILIEDTILERSFQRLKDKFKEHQI